MASGDSLCEFGPFAAESPSGSIASFDTRNLHPVLNFDGGTVCDTRFSGVIPNNYSGGGVNVRMWLTGGTATGGTMVYTTSFEKIGTAQDIDSDSFATGNLGTLAAPGTTGVFNILSVAHTDGAQMDSVTAGDLFRINISRTIGDASDNMGGTAQLGWVEIKEV